MLKSKITATEFATLPPVIQAEYTLTGTDYLLQTDDAAALRTAKQRADDEATAAKAEALAATKRATDAEAAAEAARVEAAKKAGDIPALEASWQSKLDAVKAEAATSTGNMKKALDKILVEKEALAICAEISTAPDLLMPHVVKSLVAEYDDPTDPKTRILGDDGKPTAKTIEEYKNDLIANPKFAAIIVGSKANGGAGNHKPAGGGAADKKISELTELERVALYNKVGQAEFDRMRMAEAAPAA